jgi:YD repeat-containing protein
MVGSPLGCSGAPALCTELFPYDSQNVYLRQESRTLGGSTATMTYTVDRNGNPLVTTEKDWGDSVTLRTTTLTYYNATTDALTAPDSNEAYVYWNSGAGSLLNFVSTKRVDGPTSPSSYEQYCYDAAATPTRGNVTLHARLASGSAGGTLVTCPASGTASTSSVVVTQFAYGSNGIMTSSMDGRGIATQLLYNPNGLYLTEKREACNQSLSSQACTLPERRITGYTTDLNTGKPVTVTDTDNGTELKTEYDSLGRPTKITDPSGAITTYQYFDSANPRYVLTTSSLDSTRSIRSVQCFDQMGRLTATVASENGGTPSCSGAANVIQTQRQYVYRYTTGTSGCGIGTAGRYECASNPYRSTSDSTMGWTQSKYDGAGRLVELGHVDASQQTVRSKMTYTYSGACATVKDEAANATNTDNPGSTRTVCKDAAGRISSVTEISQTTTYNYDGMDNLTDVYQGSQHRWYRYDALGRLVEAYNPEDSKTVGSQIYDTKYSYDYKGNLLSKNECARRDHLLRASGGQPVQCHGDLRHNARLRRPQPTHGKAIQ